MAREEGKKLNLRVEKCVCAMRKREKEKAQDAVRKERALCAVCVVCSLSTPINHRHRTQKASAEKRAIVC